MDNPLETVEAAVRLHREGRLPEAASAYRLALRQFPNLPELYYNLGTIVHAQENLAEAEGLYRQAIALNGSFAEAYNNLGNIFKQRGEFDAAESVLTKAVQLKPTFAEAVSNLGSVYEQRGKLDEAAEEYRRAVALQPSLSETHFNLGRLLARTGDRHAAVAALTTAATINPRFAEAYNQLGCALMELNRLEQAEAAVRRAVELRPNHVESLGNLANIFQLQGRLGEAVGLYNEILRLDPTNHIAYNDMGTVYQEAMQLDEAKACLWKAIELHPDYPLAYCNLGGCCVLQEDYEGAAEAFRKAIELKPDLHRARMLLVNQLQTLCRWDELEDLSRRLIAVVDADAEQHFIAPFSFISLPVPTTAAQQLACARNWSRSYNLSPQLDRPAVGPIDRSKIRIGYMSADFRRHAVGYMLPELFEKHDRSRFEVYAYALSGDDGTSVRRRIVEGVDVFRDIQKSTHRAAAEQIADDGIDILIDLHGYTAHSRPDILAVRPAPIQVNYIGFPGSMGADFIDYILVDDYVVPVEQQLYYQEKLVHLPGCYQVNDGRHEVAEDRPTRAECELPEDGFVFCSFNTSHKYTPHMFDIWMRLLRRVPNSVLWLAEKHSSIRNTLGREAEKRGVDRSRLIFAKIIPIAEHLARQPLADLFLDSFPYNAHATAAIALRMGVPLLTLSGETLSTRVAGSLLRVVGMESLITRTFEEYEALACRLAGDRDELAALRRRLRDNLQTTHLFDGAWFAKHVERAYERMWQLQRQGLPPEPIRVEEISCS